MPLHRSGRRSSPPVHQPPLLLGHGPVHWDTLPPEVRARALALWLQLLAAHRAHSTTDAAASQRCGGTPQCGVPQ